MPDRAVVTFAPFEFERDYLFVFALLDDFGGDFRAGNQRIAVRDAFAVSKHQHISKRRSLPSLDIQKIDIDRVALRDAILPAASFDNCVSHNESASEEKKPRKFTHLGGFGKAKGGSSAPSLDVNLGGAAALF
jgi:hypothetical protein